MEFIVNNIAGYTFAAILIAVVLILYYWWKGLGSRRTAAKIAEAKTAGTFEPASLHPYVDHNTCIGSGACIAACPEKDILGIVDGQAQTINASQCVGHGACFHACPVEAITLIMGTEKRGVELPHVKPTYETNVEGIYIAGELGGMGLIKNAVEQGRQAMENLAKNLERKSGAEYDVVIVGSGPAGISAALTAKKLKLNFKLVERESLGGTVFTFPRKKLVMTSPMELPLYGTLKLKETTKPELLDIWKALFKEHAIKVEEGVKVTNIEKDNGYLRVSAEEQEYKTEKVLLAIGRRGTPRKLNVPGEDKPKVAYRLLEPELFQDERIMVVGGGDSAIEAALALADEGNDVTISYRRDKFQRLKPKNLEKINNAQYDGTVKVIFNSNVKEIKDDSIILTLGKDEKAEIGNDYIFIFAGGELPNAFLKKIGITISKKFGEAVLKPGD